MDIMPKRSDAVPRFWKYIKQGKIGPYELVDDAPQWAKDDHAAWLEREERLKKEGYKL